MPTSKMNSSSVSLEGPGNCVVCGKETFERCSACSTHGLDWMYFCGQDHQKLIWPFHKRVCGPLAQPFRFPAFTKTEYDEMLEMTPTPYRGPDGQLTFWNANGNTPSPRGYAEHFDRSFREGLARCIAPPDGSRLPPQDERLLTVHRSQAWINRFTSGTYRQMKEFNRESLELCGIHPFDWLAHWEIEAVGILDLQPQKYFWWSDLQHKLVINLALTCLAITHCKLDGIDTVKIIDYRAYAYNEVIKYCLNVVNPLDSRMAHHLISCVSIFRPPSGAETSTMPALIDA